MKFYNNKNFNLNYFITLGLHLSNNYLQNRKIWIHNFVLGSRGFWDILNVLELLKYLQILGPIIILLVKRGGTILIINKKMTLESKLLGKLFSLEPYIGIIYIFLDNWIEGGFTNFFNFKLLNLRQLPTLLFLMDFLNSANLLNEAYFLRIPVIALTDLKQHTDFIFKKIAIPIPANNSIKSLFFFFNFLKYYVLKGLYFHNYYTIKNVFFNSFIDNINKINFSIKNFKVIKSIITKIQKSKLIYNLSFINNLKVDNQNIFKKKTFIDKYLAKICAEAIYNRGSIRHKAGKILGFVHKFDEICSKDAHILREVQKQEERKKVLDAQWDAVERAVVRHNKKKYHKNNNKISTKNENEYTNKSISFEKKDQSKFKSNYNRNKSNKHVKNNDALSQMDSFLESRKQKKNYTQKVKNNTHGKKTQN